jgi:hypothetical protein
MSVRKSTIHYFSGLSLLGLISLLAFPNVAKANSWRYIADQKDDSADLYRRTSNYRSFDIRGMGFRDDGQDLWFGISSNMNERGHSTIQGTVNGYAVPDWNIGWGDMLFDFSGRNNFRQASLNRELFGIKFTPFNDSPVATGVYRNVKGLGVQDQNAGYGNFGRLNNDLNNRPMNVGELAWNDPYWGVYSDAKYGYRTDPIANVIDSGAIRIGDVQFLDYSALYANGFSRSPSNFEHGKFLFGFKFSKSLFPNGDFIASLFQECLNDAISMRGALSFTAPPTIDPPAIDPPAIDPPTIDPPTIDPPAIDPPAIDPPTIDPPTIDPPTIDPPAIDPPAIDPPTIDPPAIDPPAIDPPAIDPPAIDPPVVNPPAIDPPVSPQSTPEPSIVVGLAGLSALLLRKRHKGS